MYNNSILYPQKIHNPVLATVDKLELHTTDFSIDDDVSIVVQPYPINTDGTQSDDLPLFRTKGGKVFTGTKAYLNTNQYNLTIQRWKGICSVRVGVNPNKLHHPYMPIPTMDDLKYQISIVRDSIRKSGINLSFDDLNVSRVDLMKQRNLSYPLAIHHPVFYAMNAKRQFKRTYDDTFLIGNRSHQTVFYDKGVESKLTNETNLIRCEVRTLKGSVTDKIFSIHTLKDLYQYDLKDLSIMYNNHLLTKVFTNEINKSSNIVSDIELIRNISTTQRFPIETYTQIRGVQGIVDTFGSVDLFASAMVDQGIITRETGYKLRKRFNDLITASIVPDKTSQQQKQELMNNIYSFAS